MSDCVRSIPILKLIAARYYHDIDICSRMEYFLEGRPSARHSSLSFLSLFQGVGNGHTHRAHAEQSPGGSQASRYSRSANLILASFLHPAPPRVPRGSSREVRHLPGLHQPGDPRILRQRSAGLRRAHRGVQSPRPPAPGSLTPRRLLFLTTVNRVLVFGRS